MLLSIWLFQCSLPLILLEIGAWQLSISHQKNARRNKRNARDFAFAQAEDIDWVKPGREFRWDGGLYDVVSIKDSSGSIVVKAFADRKEDQLIDKFKRQTDERHPLKSLTSKVKDLKIHLMSIGAIASGRSMNKIYHEFEASLLGTGALEVLVPPPNGVMA